MVFKKIIKHKKKAVAVRKKYSKKANHPYKISDKKKTNKNIDAVMSIM